MWKVDFRSQDFLVKPGAQRDFVLVSKGAEAGDEPDFVTIQSRCPAGPVVVGEDFWGKLQLAGEKLDDGIGKVIRPIGKATLLEEELEGCRESELAGGGTVVEIMDLVIA